MRRAARIDRNHAEIVLALRSVGALVRDTSGVGGGFPDLVVGFRGRVHLIEIKDGLRTPSGRKLTNGQRDFHDAWAGLARVVTDVPSALRAIGAQTSA